MTPTELETATRNKYNAIGDSFWSQDEIFGLLYEGSLEMNREALFIEAVYSALSVASQQEYAYPANTISLKRVTYNGVKLERITFNEDDQVTGFDQDTTNTGTPLYYFEWDDTISLRPVPDTTGDTIKIYAYNEPSAITSATTIDIPTQFHRCLVDYAVGMMAFKDSNLNHFDRYMVRWEMHKASAKKWSQKKRRGDRFNVVQSEDFG